MAHASSRVCGRHDILELVTIMCFGIKQACLTTCQLTVILFHLDPHKIHYLFQQNFVLFFIIISGSCPLGPFLKEYLVGLNRLGNKGVSEPKHKAQESHPPAHFHAQGTSMHPLEFELKWGRWKRQFSATKARSSSVVKSWISFDPSK